VVGSMIVVAVQAPVVLVLVVGLKEIVLIIGSHACVIGRVQNRFLSLG